MTELYAAYLWHLLRSYTVEGAPDICAKVTEGLGDLTAAVIKQHGFSFQYSVHFIRYPAFSRNG